MTPLHLAAAQGKAETVRVLLLGGANPNAEDDRDMTPLDLAKAEKQQEEIKILEKAGRK